MLKKNGFTLLELIAVIIIICIILIIVIPEVDDVMDSNNDFIYKTYSKNMITASDTYMLNQELDVSSTTPILRIQLSDLQSSGLVAINNDCEGYVLVEYTSGKVNRTAYLNCSDYITPGYDPIE